MLPRIVFNRITNTTLKSPHLFPAMPVIYTCFTPTRQLHPTISRTREVMNCQTQGHVTNPNNLHPQDPQSQSVRAAFNARAMKDGNNGCVDAVNEAAYAGEEKWPRVMGIGNPERVGFVEQVGSGSATARWFEEMEMKG